MGKKVLLLLTSAVLFAGCSLPSFLRTKYAALQITTRPDAEVYLDGEAMGTTPFKSKQIKVKDHTLRLVPKEAGLNTWETVVSLQPNITTVINYEFAKVSEQASGEVISLEQLADNQAVEIAVISVPDSASLNLDGQPKGLTPVQLKDLQEGDHILILSSPGYKDRRVDINTVKGHKLTLDVVLARETALMPTDVAADEVTTPQPTLTPSPTGKPASQTVERKLPYVEILETPTGWLRVRSAPSTAADNEVAKANTGETFPYVETNETGWHKITLPDGSEGWISGTYAKVYI